MHRVFRLPKFKILKSGTMDKTPDTYIREMSKEMPFKDLVYFAIYNYR